MKFSTISCTIEDRIAFVVIERPDALNALNEDVIREMTSCMRELRRDNSICTVIITGSGEKAFVAGADIKVMAKMTATEARVFAKFGQNLTKLIESFNKPVIAAVNGFALGGGCELAIACHIRIASENAKFGQPEVGLGLIPGFGGTQRLPRLVGRGVATELIVTGKMIDANHAEKIGLVNHVVPQNELIDLCKEIANQIAKNSPLAVKLALDAMHHGLALTLDEAINYEASEFGFLFNSHDMKEGTTAFVEKRKPDFKGE